MLDDLLSRIFAHKWTVFLVTAAWLFDMLQEALNKSIIVGFA